MNRWRIRAGLLLAATALVSVAALALASGRPTFVLVAYSVALFGHALVTFEAPSPRGALLFAASMLALLMLAPPVFSDDVHRYVWDGRLLAHGISPYAAPPNDPSLAALRDASFAQINHPRIATVYPPLAVLLFALVSKLGIFGPKLLSALAAFGLVLLVRREELAIRAPRGATFTLATFPPLLVESALEGHVDTVAVFASVAAVLALREARIARATACVIASVMTKLAGVLVLPALVRRSRIAALVVVVSFALALVPLVGSGGSTSTAGLAHYARRWAGGSPGFALVQHATERSLVATLGVGDDNVHLPFFEKVLPLVRGTPLDPRVDLGGRDKEPNRLATLHVSVVAPFFARGLIAAGLVGFAIRLARRESDALRSVRALTFAALLFVPRMLPWYALHLAPLDVLAGRRAGLLFGAVALLGHVPVERWTRERVYAEPTWAMALGFVLVLLALLHELAHERRALRD